jgi:heat shock protein HslJ
MNVTRPTWMILALSLTSIAACGSGPVNPPQGTPGATTQGPAATDEGSIVEGQEVSEAAVPGELVGAWMLVTVDGKSVPVVGKKPTMEVSEDGTVSGVGGVNRFNTRIEVVDGRLSFGPTAATKMAGPPEAMDLESAFFARLGAVSTYEIDGETLRLWAGDNEALVFERSED